MPASDPPPTETAAPPAAPRLPHWRLRRNCALTPVQSLAGWALPAVLLAGSALGLWWMGGGWAALCPAAALLGVVAAIVCHARHALDGETVQLEGQHLWVEAQHGTRTTRARLDGTQARVQHLRERGVVALRSRGTAVQVGREVTAAERERFASELLHALHTRSHPGAWAAWAGEAAWMRDGARDTS